MESYQGEGGGGGGGGITQSFRIKFAAIFFLNVDFPIFDIY